MKWFKDADEGTIIGLTIILFYLLIAALIFAWT